MPYWEGQSYGVVPPGTNPKNGKPNNVRLYSIASTRYGDDLKGQTASLCVRRATYWCPELKADDSSKKGICSNFLCDAKPGKKHALPPSLPPSLSVLPSTGPMPTTTRSPPSLPFLL